VTVVTRTPLPELTAFTATWHRLLWSIGGALTAACVTAIIKFVLPGLMIAWRAPIAEAVRRVMYPQKKSAYWTIPKSTIKKTGITSANSTSCEPDRRLRSAGMAPCIFLFISPQLLRGNLPKECIAFFLFVQLKPIKILGCEAMRRGTAQHQFRPAFRPNWAGILTGLLGNWLNVSACGVVTDWAVTGVRLTGHSCVSSCTEHRCSQCKVW